MQAGVDQPGRHRVRVVQQRRDAPPDRGTRGATKTRTGGAVGGSSTGGAACGLRTGGRLQKPATIFFSPVQPTLHDYYEPWTHDYCRT